MHAAHHPRPTAHHLTNTVEPTGCARQVNIDNCPGVVEQQKVREPDMVWDLGDVREMEYETDRFDVVFDKGLLDNLQVSLGAVTTTTTVTTVARSWTWVG